MSRKPSSSERARELICPECGGEVVRRSARGPVPRFCSAKCKRDFGNRQLIEGRAVIGFLKAWRIDRGSGPIAKASLAQICSIVDAFNAQDREAGRPRADLYAAKLLNTGMLYMDREVRTRRGRAKRDDEVEQAAE